MYLSEIIVEMARKAVRFQAGDGSMPEGHNGPWNQMDTRVRTTAHWALSFYKAYEITLEQKYREASLRACNYLLRKEAAPFDYSFYCRKSESPGARPNGLIGQAWATEPLIEISLKENNSLYREKAISILEMHPYSFKKHGWETIHLNGERGKYEYTINQQIWFAVMANKLRKYSIQLNERSLDFFNNLSGNISFISTGWIKHTSYKLQNQNILPYWKNKIFENTLKKRKDRVKLLSSGYQSFILYALQVFLNGEFKNINEFDFVKNVLIHSSNHKNIDLYRNNPYCFGYNVTGIELAFVLESNGNLDEAQWWLNQQFHFTYDHKLKEFLGANVSDKIVVQSRIYEATRLIKDYFIKI